MGISSNLLTELFFVVHTGPGKGPVNGDSAQGRGQTAGSVAEAGSIMFVTIVIAIFTI